ncbi:MAG: FkbM family methyltransferase [Parasulfuritortus sp.]|jgi:FkbM family methyltransferase|nr:FkbM family methyltransferase [Parasulfuritortus sp.]
MKSLSDIRTRYQAGKMPKQAYIDEMHEMHQMLFKYSAFLREGDVENINITDHEVIFTSRSRGIRLVVDPLDQHLVPYTLLNFNTYDEAELALLLEIVSPDSVIFDIGANCGWYSLVMARAFQQASIHAFEPIPSTCRTLARNLELNDIRNITIHPLGISDSCGTQDFLYTPTCSGATSLRLAGQPGEVSRISAATETLDAFCDREKHIPGFIKCDVEGAELMVLRGGTSILSAHSPILFLELLRKWSAKFDYHPNDVIDFLSSFGYRCYTAYEKSLAPCDRVTEDTKETNFLFLHPDKHGKILEQFASLHSNSATDLP